MAKKDSVNRAKAIRDYYAAHPAAKPLQVQSGLREEGIEVDTTYISTVRNQMKMKGAKLKQSKAGRPKSTGGSSKKTAKHTVRSNSSSNNFSGAYPGVSITAEALLNLKQLSIDLGGVSETRKALDLLEQLALRDE